MNHIYNPESLLKCDLWLIDNGLWLALDYSDFPIFFLLWNVSIAVCTPVNLCISNNASIGKILDIENKNYYPSVGIRLTVAKIGHTVDLMSKGGECTVT